MEMSPRVVGAGQDTREQDAVVVAVRLVAEHRDVEPLAAAPGQQVFDESGAGHAVADDDESGFGGQGMSSLPQGETRTAQTLNSGIRLIGSSASLVRRLTDARRLPVERHEHRVFADVAGQPGLEARRRRAAWSARCGSPSATPAEPRGQRMHLRERLRRGRQQFGDAPRLSAGLVVLRESGRW